MIKASKELIKKNDHNIQNMNICPNHNILYHSFEKYPFDGLIINIYCIDFQASNKCSDAAITFLKEI